MPASYRQKRFRVLGWVTIFVAGLLAADSAIMALTNYEQGATHVFLRGFGIKLKFTRAEDLIGAAVVVGLLGLLSLILGRNAGPAPTPQAGQSVANMKEDSR